MYTREEASKLKSEFWTTFGKYISPHLSAEGWKINWVNYKTGIKNLYFRMNATHKHAYIAIEMSHPDPDIQQLFFEHMEALKVIFENTMEEEWIWKLHDEDEHGKIITRIYTEIPHVNIFVKDDWPTLISFFKPRILLLDEFWSYAKDSFDELKSLM